MLRDLTVSRIVTVTSAIVLPVLLMLGGFAYLPGLMWAMADQVGMEMVPWMFLGTYVGLTIHTMLCSWATLTGRRYEDLIALPDSDY